MHRYRILLMAVLAALPGYGVDFIVYNHSNRNVYFWPSFIGCEGEHPEWPAPGMKDSTFSMISDCWITEVLWSYEEQNPHFNKLAENEDLKKIPGSYPFPPGDSGTGCYVVGIENDPADPDRLRFFIDPGTMPKEFRLKNPEIFGTDESLWPVAGRTPRRRQVRNPAPRP